MRRAARTLALLSLAAELFSLGACGPVPPPSSPYRSGRDLLGDMEKLRSAVRGFRITGRIDHRDEAGTVRGKIFVFASLPDRLRVELISPFETPLSVLTVNRSRFALHDLRESRYLTGAPEPCNLARLIEVPLPVEAVLRILVGSTPLVPGEPRISWDRRGFYRVEIQSAEGVQRLDVGPAPGELPLLRSRLEDRLGPVFDIAYGRWYPAGGISVPHEIRIAMPRHRADLTVRYNAGGVELNPALPDDAFDQAPPDGVPVEAVSCP